MDHLAKGWGTYSFSLHLRALPRNFITHFMLSRWIELSRPKLMAMSDRRKYQILNRALAAFWFVGAHSDCDQVIAAIGADLGLPPIAAPRNTSAELQAHTGWRLVTAQSLSPSVRDAIRANNALDQALWESWGAAGFDPAKVRPAGLGPNRNTARAHEMIRPWFRFRRFVRREWVGRRPPSGVTVERANRARDAGEWELAARHYREALRAVPNAPAIWVQYGHALKESGRVAEAEQAYRRSLKLDPDTADTHLQLGHALSSKRDSARRRTPTCGGDARSDVRHARNELIGLGWPAERIARAIRPSERGAAFPRLRIGIITSVLFCRGEIQRLERLRERVGANANLASFLAIVETSRGVDKPFRADEVLRSFYLPRQVSLLPGVTRYRPRVRPPVKSSIKR